MSWLRVSSRPPVFSRGGRGTVGPVKIGLLGSESLSFFFAALSLKLLEWPSEALAISGVDPLSSGPDGEDPWRLGGVGEAAAGGMSLLFALGFWSAGDWARAILSACETAASASRSRGVGDLLWARSGLGSLAGGRAGVGRFNFLWFGGNR